MPHVRWFPECSHQHLNEVGGKCASLGEMLQAGLPVPPGFAVSTRAFAFFLHETGLHEAIGDVLTGLAARDLDGIEAHSARIQNLVHQTPMPRRLEQAIRDGYDRLAEAAGDDSLPVAVRSSATAEDSPDASFAGLHETYLWVRGHQALLETTVACWASLYTPRALAYRLHMGLDHAAMLLSVGVQQMVQSRAAGVMFTLDPSNGDPSQIVIEGAWGLGEAVVRGEVTPDRYKVNKVTLEPESRVISAKTLEYVPDLRAAGGVLCREVAAPRQLEPCLSEAEAVALAALGKRIEKHYGRPMDIEWAIDARFPHPRNVFLVQARPETVWSRKKRQVLDTAPPAQALGYVVNFLTRH